MSPISKQESIFKWQLLTQWVFLSVVSLGMCIQIMLKDWHNSQKLMVNSKWTQQYFSRYFSLIIPYFVIFLHYWSPVYILWFVIFNDFLCVDESLPLCVYVFIFIYSFVCLFFHFILFWFIYLIFLGFFEREKEGIGLHDWGESSSRWGWGSYDKNILYE